MTSSACVSFSLQNTNKRSSQRAKFFGVDALHRTKRAESFTSERIVLDFPVHLAHETSVRTFASLVPSASGLAWPVASVGRRSNRSSLGTHFSASVWVDDRRHRRVRVPSSAVQSSAESDAQVIAGASEYRAGCARGQSACTWSTQARVWHTSRTSSSVLLGVTTMTKRLRRNQRHRF